MTLLREPVIQDDVLEAIHTTKPTSNEELNKKYQEWKDQFGSQ